MSEDKDNKTVLMLEENFLYHHSLIVKEQDRMFDFAGFDKTLKKASSLSLDKFLDYILEKSEEEFNVILRFFGSRNFYLNLNKFLIKESIDNFIKDLKLKLSSILELQEQYCSTGAKYKYKYLLEEKRSTGIILEWILSFESIFSFVFSMEKDRFFFYRKESNVLYKTLGFSKVSVFDVFKEEKYKDNIIILLFMLVSKLKFISSSFSFKGLDILDLETFILKLKNLDPESLGCDSYRTYEKNFRNLVLDFSTLYLESIEKFYSYLKEEDSKGLNEKESILELDSDIVDESIYLLSKDMEVSKAEEAIEDLKKYIVSQNIDIEDIILGEILCINPNLKEEVFNNIKRKLKNKNTESNKNTANIIKKVKSLLVVSFCVLFFIIGCGVKTAPKSDIIEYKPPIPYHDVGEQRINK